MIFALLIFVEKKIIKFEPKVEVLIAIDDIEAESELNKALFKVYQVPLNLSLEADMNLDFNKIEGKYSRNKIYKGQILLKNHIGDKEELKIIEVPQNKEKISIKLKNPENAISFQIKPDDKINVYFTGKYNAVKSMLPAGTVEENKLYTVKIIEQEEILGVFDEKGVSYNLSDFGNPDTIILGVNPDKAVLINNLRSQGTFDITG